MRHSPAPASTAAMSSSVMPGVPEMRRYRYIVAGSESDVVIVDPNDNAVVLVINE
jgi:hypothetical protein